MCQNSVTVTKRPVSDAWRNHAACHSVQSAKVFAWKQVCVRCTNCMDVAQYTVASGSFNHTAVLSVWKRSCRNK